MTITYSEFTQAIAENEGEILATTARRAMFRAFVGGNGVRFTPVSSGKTRKVNEAGIRRYLAIFNSTQSTVTTDYRDKMKNASYVLGIIQLLIGQSSAAPAIEDETSASAAIDPAFSAAEGEERVRAHCQRERSRELVMMAKRVFQGQNNGHLFCEVCGFDFGAVYGAPDFIEAHHRVPLRDLKLGSKTKVSDLAMVCANCHRMLHRGSPWPTVEELKRQLRVVPTTAPASKCPPPSSKPRAPQS